MQTFADFINKRFGLNENEDQNQQTVPVKMRQKTAELENIIHAILDNPNYFDKFFETIKQFVKDIQDNVLNNMIENLEESIKENGKDKGLGQLDGESHKPNNLPPNMGG